MVNTTDAGLRALAKGTFTCLEDFTIQSGSWEKGYPQLITATGINTEHYVLANSSYYFAKCKVCLGH